MARHKAREQTLQMLFEWDLRRAPLDDIARGYYGSLLVSEDSVAKPRPDAFAQNLLQGITEELPVIDDLIARHAANWRIERMPAVDRNVLRIAVYEMLRTDTPAAIVIDEALELARRFAGEESVQFVNGVLDAVRRELPREITVDGGSTRIVAGIIEPNRDWKERQRNSPGYADSATPGSMPASARRTNRQSSAAAS